MERVQVAKLSVIVKDSLIGIANINKRIYSFIFFIIGRVPFKLMQSLILLFQQNLHFSENVE